ncbi:MAG: lamin tail domain-containing protein [Acidimicrobiales bacterium]|nr:lamin tail domain-containing protein [Acidimicrobiales bacterium]
MVSRSPNAPAAWSRLVGLRLTAAILAVGAALFVAAPSGDALAASGGSVVDIDYASVEGMEGVYLTHSDGTVEARDGLPHYGDRPAIEVGESIIGLSVRPDVDGYWLFTNRGRVFPFGAAVSFGDTSAIELAAPMISAIAMPDGLGYYMVAEDGGIFTFGSAVFYGSVPQILPGVTLDAPVIGIVPSPTGKGYLLVAEDGGIFTFGDARFYGSVPGVLPGVTLDAGVVAVIAQPSGYLMVAQDGGIFTFGTAIFHGSLGGTGTDGIVGVAVKPDNSGYAMVDSVGTMHPFGSASSLGTLTGFDPASVRSTLALFSVAASPVGDPYDRADYQPAGWRDSDGDCRNDRHEVLAAESEIAVTYDATGCFVQSGRWTDPYSGQIYSDASQVQVDHVVSLAAAHRAGAWKWDLATKQDFASDLGYAGTLVIVGADSNNDKADQGPATWRPPLESRWCSFALNWIHTKQRWSLPLESEAERSSLVDMLVRCPTSSVDAYQVAEPQLAQIVEAPTTTTTGPTTTQGTSPGTVEITFCDARSEVVRLHNPGATSVSLTGYYLHDEGDKHTLTFPSGVVLGAGATLDVETGPNAAPGPGVYFWHNGNVWNNDGDTAFLVAPGGSLVTRRCFT